MKRSPYLVMDTETGGLDPAQNPITSFAAVVLDFNTLKEVDRWETYVKPYNDLQITKESIQKTMVNMAEVNRGMELNAFIDAFMRFCTQNFADIKGKDQRRLVAVGHNVMFDVGMLEAAFY
ncbi:MAG: 3'-5' exonuclease, partial [Enterobacteriaceae bacterium]